MATDKEDPTSEPEKQNTSPLHYPADELTDAEKRELLEQLDRSIIEKPVPAPSTDLPQLAEKKGYIQPLFINITALIVVLVAFGIAFTVFRSRQVRLALDTSRYYSAEGKILEAFKRQSEQQLKEKDNLIYRILKQLEVLENQRGEMNRLIGLNITKKREALDAEIHTSLELEKERLAAAGYDPSEITSLLTKMEQEKEQERDAKLEEYRNESVELLKAQEAALLSKIRENEKTLQSVTDEREQLAKEIALRERELTAEAGDASDEEGPAAADAYAKLKKIMDAREREALLMDQINASFSFALSRIAVYDAPAASGALNSIKKLLADPAIKELPSVLKRKDVDLSIVSTLENYVQERKGWASGGAVAAAEELPPEGTGASDAGADDAGADDAGTDETGPATDQGSRDRLDQEIMDLNEIINKRDGEIAALRAAFQARDDDMQNLMDRLTRAEDAIEAEAAKGLKVGRDLAFEDVLALLDAYSNLSVDQAVNPELTENLLEFDDQRLASINESIQYLIGQLVEPYGLKAAQYKILGTVTLITQDGIVIEPLISASVESGSLIEVRRTMDNGEVFVIGRGKVETDAEGRITANITTTPLSGLSPHVTDEVYIASSAAAE